MNVYPKNPSLQTNLPRFGSAGSGVGLKPDLGRHTLRIDKGMGWLSSTRTKQMLVEDVAGFGFLRGGLDLMRGYIYGTGVLNWPAATERLAREGASIFTDNILSGIAAHLMGAVFDSKGKSFSNGFTDYPTLEAFQKVIGEKGKNSLVNEVNFIDKFGEHLVQGVNQSLRKAKQPELALDRATAFKKNLGDIWSNDWEGHAKQPQLAKTWKTETQAKRAIELAKALGQDDFDLKTLGHTFKLDNLLDDLRLFKTHMATRLPNSGMPWVETAANSIKNTLVAKNWKLGAIGLGMGATFGVPFLIAYSTKHHFGIDFYPGEIGLGDKNKPKTNIFGLAQGQTAKSPKPARDKQNSTPQVPFKDRLAGFFNKHMPYISQELKKGNPLPLLLALAPLPFAVGVLDVAALKWIRIKGPGAWTLKKFRNMYDFNKGWPFTSPQQMASMFALLITSRLMCSRGDNEFKERMLDSFAGWGVWILGTPLMQKMAATMMDKGHFPGVGKTNLLKADGTIRSRSEIEFLFNKFAKEGSQKEAQILQSTLKANIWMGAGTTLITMAMLGIVTPLVGMLWTQQNEKNKQKKQALQTSTAAKAPPPLNSGGKPFGYVTQPKPFTPVSTSMNSGFNMASPANPLNNTAPWPLPAPGFTQQPG